MERTFDLQEKPLEDEKFHVWLLSCWIYSHQMSQQLGPSSSVISVLYGPSSNVVHVLYGPTEELLLAQYTVVLFTSHSPGLFLCSSVKLGMRPGTTALCSEYCPHLLQRWWYWWCLVKNLSVLFLRHIICVLWFLLVHIGGYHAGVWFWWFFFFSVKCILY